MMATLLSRIYTSVEYGNYKRKAQKGGGDPPLKVSVCYLWKDVAVHFGQFI